MVYFQYDTLDGISFRSRSRWPGLTEDQIWDMIFVEVVTSVRGSIIEFFRSIKTTLIEIFDDHYDILFVAVVDVATTAVVVIGVRRERAF